MAKKKKNVAVNETETPSKLNETMSCELPILDWMELTLLNVSKGKGFDSPHILLTKRDAYSLNVFNDDQVLILVHKDGVPVKLAICSTRIVTPYNETPRKSPSRTVVSASPSGRAVKQPLANGSCHVVPPSLLERLCSIEGDGNEKVSWNEQHDHDHTPTTITGFISDDNNIVHKNTTFSFARGGGGDALVASPSSKTDVTARRSSQKASKLVKQMVWIVPLGNEFGVQLTALLCKPCKALTLQPMTSIHANACRVVQKLAAFRTADTFVLEGDTIGVSFQGKLLHLCVQTAKRGESTPIQGIEQAMHELALEHDVEVVSSDLDKRHITTAVQSSLADPVLATNLQLFHVHSNTEIIIDSEHKENECSARGPFVAGLDDAIDKIMSTMIPALLYPESFGGLKPPRGVLLFGPGGVGKSALARQIASHVAIQYPQVHVENVHSSLIQSRAAVVGEGERILMKLFHRSQKTLLILDDIHFICPKRGSNDTNANMDRLTSTLLALLDGVERNDNVFLLATTADPTQLDPALRRPGRLDDEVEVPIPDEKTRAKIWKFHIDRLRVTDMKINVFSDDDLDNLARLAKGFTGADCLLAIKEATRMLMDDEKYLQALTMDVLKAAIRTTKPSTISSITVEVPKVSWNSIGGMVDVKEKLRDAIELPLTHAALFAKFKITPPRGVLLYGPPGCSKTLMARALATEGKMNFLAVKGPELLSKWLGESERALASLFRRARMASPCIIFFDEIDAIASKRGGGGSAGGGERLLSQLLTELDGIGTARQEKSHVIVVAATNRPDLLDHALTRPGRIDRKIYVGLPDRFSREQIFEISLKNKSHADDINYHGLAADEISGGFSGAEIVSICRDAALLALEEDDEGMTVHDDTPQSLMIQMRHLTKAIQTTPRQISQGMLDFYADYTKTF